jgi:hypothetical protein
MVDLPPSQVTSIAAVTQHFDPVSEFTNLPQAVRDIDYADSSRAQLLDDLE